MALILMEPADRAALEAMVGRGQPEPLVLRLFTNDFTPSELDTAEMYRECAAPGYAPASLDPDSWEYHQHPPGVACSPRVFQTQESATIYGYYLTTDGGVLAMAQRADEGPITLERPTDELVLAPALVRGTR